MRPSLFGLQLVCSALGTTVLVLTTLPVLHAFFTAFALVVHFTIEDFLLFGRQGCIKAFHGLEA